MKSPYGKTATNEQKKEAVQTAAKAAAERSKKETTMEGQMKNQSLVVGLMGYVPGFDAYKNSLEQLPIETENYTMTQALLNLVMKKYQLGQATMIDVKQAQQSFENAGFRWVSLLYTAKIAEVELKRISNQLKF